MVMSWIWTMILGMSLLCALLTGRGSALATGIIEGAQSAITLAISIGGSLCLWTGVGRLIEKAGITAMLSKLLQPLLYRLFPSTRHDKQLSQALSGNICANFLGLGNAATPLGIQATKRLIDQKHPDLATDQMCRLIVLNTASIQLIPTNVAAVRASLSAAAPFDILPAVWVTSLCSAGLGVLLAVILGKVTRHD